jgi:hypothetical protein
MTTATVEATDAIAIPQSIRVDVTQQDIALGCLGNQHRCAVAQAVWRIFPNILTVEVTGSAQPGGPDIDVLLRGVPQVLSYRAPEWVGEFMEKYDCGEKVEPISFDAELMEVPALKGLLRRLRLRIAVGR